jgi:hypothetical protein
MYIQPLTVTLEMTEWQFLITILQGTSTMLQSLGAVRDALPSGLELPIAPEMIVNITALTERIEEQMKTPTSPLPKEERRVF